MAGQAFANPGFFMAACRWQQAGRYGGANVLFERYAVSDRVGDQSVDFAVFRVDQYEPVFGIEKGKGFREGFDRRCQAHRRCFHAPSCGDVERHRNDMRRCAVGVEQRYLGREKEMTQPFAVHPIFFVIQLALAGGEDIAVDACGVFAVFTPHQFRCRLADRLFGSRAVMPRLVMIHKDVPGISILDIDHRGHRVDDRHEEAFAFALCFHWRRIAPTKCLTEQKHGSGQY